LAGIVIKIAEFRFEDGFRQNRERYTELKIGMIIDVLQKAGG